MRYQGDPHWIEARFSCKCSRCGSEIKKGEQAFYYPRGKSVFCKAPGCGEKESVSFDQAAFDEAQYTGNY